MMRNKKNSHMMSGHDSENLYANYYNTLQEQFGNEKVQRAEEYLEAKYPIAFGKATNERRIRLLREFLKVR